MSQVLTQASAQWASRPADERFTSLYAMQDMMERVRATSRATVVSSRSVMAIPLDARTLRIEGRSGAQYEPTHWAFGQLAALAEAPAGYLRTLPAPMVADCLNYGLHHKRGPADVGILLRKGGADAGDILPSLRAATGPAYGRIWNADIVRTLTDFVGDGIGSTSDWKVPGEFGQDIEVTKANTTLYASDRDMFVFLADEKNRIEVPNRRNGESGSLARGFFLQNSEVGASTFRLGTFLFDYACYNRIIWGAQGFKEIAIRHTAKAPDRWLEEVKPTLLAYSRASQAGVVDMVKAAQAKRVDDLDVFLAARFGKGLVEPIKAAHEADEGRPIESLWDVTTGATAYARTISWQDDRVDMERKAGAVLTMATA